jgi:hypothetical protein
MDKAGLMRSFLDAEPGPVAADALLNGRLLSHAAGHEASDRRMTVEIERPKHGTAKPVWLRE